MSRNSDRRKIKDVQNILGAHALEKIAALQTVSFRNIDEDPNQPISIGFIAQDFEKVFPDLVRKRKKDDGIKPIKKPKPPRVPEPLPVPGSGTAQPETPAPTVPVNPGTGGSNTNPAPGTSGGPRTLAAFFTDDPIAPVGEAKGEVTALAAANDDESDDDDSISVIEQQGFQITSYEELIPMLVGAVKELALINEGLTAKLDELEKKVAKLKPALTA
jgi:hypothetical protein